MQEKEKHSSIFFFTLFQGESWEACILRVLQINKVMQHARQTLKQGQWTVSRGAAVSPIVLTPHTKLSSLVQILGVMSHLWRSSE